MSVTSWRRAIEQGAYRVVKRNPTVRRMAEATLETVKSARAVVDRRRGALVAAPRVIVDTTELDFRAVEPGELVRRTLPICLSADHHPRFEREQSESLAGAGVTVLPGGRTWDGRAVLTADGRLVDSLAFELDPRQERYLREPERHPLLHAQAMPAPRRLAGRVAALSVPGGAGYYHWLIDMLPRLHLLEQAGFALDTIDTFVVNLAVADFQLETLARFGIGPDRLVTSQRHEHIQADELLAPDLPGGFGRPPGWVIEFLQSRLARIDQSAPRPSRRVYASRRRAAHRQLANSEAVEAVVANHGFDVVELETLSFDEQLDLFATTAAFCGTHGAGLTNIALCPLGGTVVSLMSPRDPSHVYWTLTNQCRGRFAYVFGPGAILDEAEFDRVRFGSEDQAVDPDRLDELLGQTLLSAEPR